MLPYLLGHANAPNPQFSGRMSDAPEAQHIGLVNQGFPKDVILDTVYEYPRDLASNVSPRSLRVSKWQLYDLDPS